MYVEYKDGTERLIKLTNANTSGGGGFLHRCVASPRLEYRTEGEVREGEKGKERRGEERSGEERIRRRSAGPESPINAKPSLIRNVGSHRPALSNHPYVSLSNSTPPMYRA